VAPCTLATTQQLEGSGMLGSSLQLRYPLLPLHTDTMVCLQGPV
jgi:hypothetical protein